MKDNLVSAMRRCFVPALFSMLALVLTARGDDLLDAVLNAPSAEEEKVEEPTVSETEASTIVVSAPDDRGETPVIRFNREGVGDNLSVTWLTGLQVAGDGLGGDRYSLGDDLGVSAQLEFRAPLSNWLSLDVRGLYLYETHEEEGTYQETYYTYYSYYSWYYGWYSVPYRQSRTVYWHLSATWKTMLGDASLCVNPWRGEVFDPFIGIGVRYARSEEEIEYEKNGREENYDWDDSKTSILLRIGAQLNAGRFSLKAEYLFFDDGKDDEDIGPKGEAIGSLGFFVTPEFQLLLFTDYFIWEESENCYVGIGLSLDF